MNFATLDLNLLRVLDALLREQSTTRAAERLGMSQPAVSGALARLRQSLDDPLFVRHGQGLRPTDYAASLALPLRESLDQLEALLAGPPAFDPGSAQMTFKMAGSDFFAEMLLPALAREIRSSAPGVRAQLVDLVPYSYVDSLERYEADLALLPDAEFPPWTNRQPLFWSSFVTIAARDNPALARAGVAPGETIPMDLFCELGHVLFSPEGKLQAMGDAALAAVGRSRNVAMTLPVFSGVCRAVSQSDLIALVPRQLADRMAGPLDLATYHAPMPVKPALIVALWHKRATASPAHRWMRGLIAQILSPLNEGEKPLPAS